MSLPIAHSSSLKDLRKLITDGLLKSDVFVLMLTKDVLTRPWVRATHRHPRIPGPMSMSTLHAFPYGCGAVSGSHVRTHAP